LEVGVRFAFVVCLVSYLLAGEHIHRQADKLVRFIPLHCSPLTNVYITFAGPSQQQQQQQQHKGRHKRK
jgi:hypothetical protein